MMVVTNVFIIGILFVVSSTGYKILNRCRLSKFIIRNNCDDKCEPNNCSNEILNNLEIDIAKPIIIEELSDENLIKIVNLECNDEQCNYLCWKCLGYQYNFNTNLFELSDKVFPKWAKKYPLPPDVIGVTRNYADPVVDKPVRDASMDLMRSIPKDFKGGVRNLESKGFRGYKLSELTPNKTRRAQLVNWLIFYRERLFGKTIEQLQAEAADRKLKESQQQVVDNASTVSQTVDMLPSEVMYQRKRLDTLEE